MENMFVYEFLTNLNVMWDRKSETEIWVATNGYNTALRQEIEIALLPFKFSCIKEVWDKQSGKMIVYYKHRKLEVV